jgi:hypothetical protein
VKTEQDGQVQTAAVTRAKRNAEEAEQQRLLLRRGREEG